MKSITPTTGYMVSPPYYVPQVYTMSPKFCLKAVYRTLDTVPTLDLDARAVYFLACRCMLHGHLLLLNCTSGVVQARPARHACLLAHVAAQDA